ncbi:hypothetical protein QYM39_06035 [Pediococcus pentosaceus]|uniref:hypothetical protein n=1 Tax=Pediococcus pentosaceus TaxID=1255 RepID=UPI00265AE7B0|nr:hypothetical protein [Pediococcus pentosaceus]WKF70467.1 hypothetical protein QYM39_06035 [Pediococcus pentosaceus]
MSIRTFGSQNQILANVENKVAYPVTVNATGVTADSHGRKIIPAGTPIGGAKNALQDDTVVLSVANDATAQGVLEHDIDVTAGESAGTMIVWGWVNEYRMKNVTVSDEAKTALNGKVTFIKRNDM